MSRLILILAIGTALAPAFAQHDSPAEPGWLTSINDIRIALDRAQMLPELDMYPFRQAVDLKLISGRTLSGIVAEVQADRFILLESANREAVTLPVTAVSALRLRASLTPDEAKLSQTQVVRRRFPDAGSSVTVVTSEGKKYRGRVIEIGMLAVCLEIEKSRERVSVRYAEMKKAGVNSSLGEKLVKWIPFPSK